MKSITMLVMDVDGTLTDGKIYMGENYEIMKVFCIKDGYAIRNLLPKYGIVPVFLTARESVIIENRAKELNVDFVYQATNDKLALLNSIINEKNVTFENIAYIGDDLNDIDCMKVCGLRGCPSDAADEIKNIVDFISSKEGGNGAVREFIEWVISRTSF